MVSYWQPYFDKTTEINKMVLIYNIERITKRMGNKIWNYV